MSRSDPSQVVDFAIPSAEKRREGGKHYVYEIVVSYANGSRKRIWRRYSQFDALRDTVQDILGLDKPLPRLTRKLYLKRSAVHEVAIHRQPKLIRFLKQLLPMLQDDAQLCNVLSYFLTPTETDKARSALEDPDNLLRFDGQHVHRRRRASDQHTGPTCVVALMDVEPESGEELAFCEGEVLTVVARYDDGWLECSRGEAKGLVSPEYVEEASASGMDGRDQAAKPTSAVEELLTTERQYLENLKQVRDDFFVKLRALVSAPEAKMFFNNWAELIPLHQACVQDLESGGSSSLNATLTHHFRRFEGPYCRYCAGIPAAQELYEAKCREKAFAKFEASFPALNKPTLNHFMRPFQRVLKYPLLIRELTTSNNQDMADAMEAASHLAEQANLNMNNPQHRIKKDDISGPEGMQHTTSSLPAMRDPLSTSTASAPASTRPRPPPPPRPPVHHHSSSSSVSPSPVPHATPPPPPPPSAKPSVVPVNTAVASGSCGDAQEKKQPPPPPKPPQPQVWHGLRQAGGVQEDEDREEKDRGATDEHKVALQPPPATADTTDQQRGDVHAGGHRSGQQHGRPPPPPAPPSIRKKPSLTPPPQTAGSSAGPRAGTRASPLSGQEHGGAAKADHRRPPPPSHGSPAANVSAGNSSSSSVDHVSMGNKPPPPPKPAALRKPKLKPKPTTKQ